jgi:hypothetical protein
VPAALGHRHNVIESRACRVTRWQVAIDLAAADTATPIVTLEHAPSVNGLVLNTSPLGALTISP